MKFAVQLYSVRDQIKTGEDMLNILGKVKELGFDGVEFAGYFGLTAEQLKARLDELGLVPVGTHIGLDNYKPDKLKETIEFGKTIGFKYMGVGGAPHSTEEECTDTGSTLGNAAKAAKDAGITMYYHNHCEEFKPLPDGRFPIDIIKSLTKIQVDTYWSFYAGVDNYKFITENKDDIVLIHIKDGIDGGIIVGIFAAFLTCHFEKLSFLKLLDIAGMSLLIGQGIGRWGNFMNQEAFGTNTLLPWGMTSDKIVDYINKNQLFFYEKGIVMDPNIPVHPTFLYESLWCLAGFIILYIFCKKFRQDQRPADRCKPY